MRRRLSLGAFVVGISVLAMAPIAPAQVFTDQPAGTRPKPAPKPAAKPKPKPRKPPARQPASAPQQRQQAIPRVVTYTDPAAYCAATPDIDTPGETYVGQPIPDWIAAASTPTAARSPTFNWRCMSGKVLACTIEPGRVDCARPSLEETASREMADHCKGKGIAPIPIEMAGDTVAIWGCRNGAAVVTGHRGKVDARGFYAAQWRDVTDYAPANLVGGVHKSFLGDWYVPIKVSLMSSLGQSVLVNGKPASVPLTGALLRVTGGPQNASIGRIEYYTEAGQRLQLICAADMILVSSDPGRLEFFEQLGRSDASSRCGRGERLKLVLRGNQMWVEWYANGSAKPKRSAMGQRYSG